MPHERSFREGSLTSDFCHTFEHPLLDGDASGLHLGATLRANASRQEPTADFLQFVKVRSFQTEKSLHGDDLALHPLSGRLTSLHRDHRLDTGQGIPRSICVNRGQRAIVAGIHGLEHVQRLSTTHLSDHNPVRAHTKGVDHQLPLRHRALALDIGRPGFQTCHVLLM